jgi:hypothetical protein
MDQYQYQSLTEAYQNVYQEEAIEEELDLYDVILTHLMNEGFADTEDAAEIIMAHMSEEWRNEILEASATSDEILSAVRAGGRAKEIMSKRIAPGGDSTGISDDHPINVAARKKAEQEKASKRRLRDVQIK